VRSRIQDVHGGADAYVESQDGAKIHAKHILVAANTPMNDMVTMHTKQAPYRTYALGFRLADSEYFDDLYWDTDEPFHYVRCQWLPKAKDESNGRRREALLIVGGEDHKTGQAETSEEDCFARLEAWTREHFPQAAAVHYSWSGQIFETLDMLGFAGRNPGDDDNVYLITGDCGVGMTNSTLGAMLVRDLITGATNPWTSLYDPARKPLSGAWTYTKENVNVAMQYLDWLTSGDVDDVEKIGRHQGAVVRRGLHKLAVYRDEHGKLHEMSAKCPHLSCVVGWNDAEKSWDCPCHGSRFDPQGKLLCGPAISDLKPAEQPAKEN